MSEADRTARHAQLDELAAEVMVCPRCELAKSRNKAVPGEGPYDADLMFIGEAPGYHENMQGRPFVGPSGRFLDELLASINLSREQVFITNIVKCRPPNNRDPFPAEIEACAPYYLVRQIELIQPLMIVTLGRFSMAHFTPFRGKSISKIHGNPHREAAYFLYPMFHPAAALHRQDLIDTVRADMLKIPGLLTEARANREKNQGTVSSPDDEAPQQLSLF